MNCEKRRGGGGYECVAVPAYTHVATYMMGAGGRVLSLCDMMINPERMDISPTKNPQAGAGGGCVAWRGVAYHSV